MSSEQPPNPIVDTFNPEYWRITADGGITTQFLDANYLKFPLSQNAQETFVAIPNISATMPPSNDSSTKIPTTAWVQSAIPSLTDYATLNTIQTFSAEKTFSVMPLNTAVQPASNDSTTKIPTTAWVQTAIDGRAPPTLSAVLTSGTDASGQSITNLGTLNFSDATNQTTAYTGSTIVPALQATNITNKEFVYNTRLEDFDCDTGSTQFAGQVIVFNETGPGAYTPYTGTYASDVIGGMTGRRGVLQLTSGGSSGNETMLLTDIVYTIANITSVRYGFNPLGNENLATLGRTPAGNIIQLLGLSATAQQAGSASTQSIIWRLSSGSATPAVWNFVMNNVVFYTLAMADPTGSWCSVSIDITEPTAGNYFVQSTFSNFTTGVVETTATYPLPVGFLTAPNTIGLHITCGTNNNTAKFLAVDYVQLTQNLYNIGGGIDGTLYR
jgi:hypothetical protein